MWVDQNFSGVNLSHFAEFSGFCVAPEIFQFVKLARFRVKNVDDDIEIIHQDPLGVARSFGMGGHGAHLFFHFFVNAVGDGFDVCVGIAFTNDKKVSGGIAEFAKIELDNIFAFFIPDALDDEVVEFFGICRSGSGPSVSSSGNQNTNC